MGNGPGTAAKLIGRLSTAYKKALISSDGAFQIACHDPTTALLKQFREDRGGL